MAAYPNSLPSDSYQGVVNGITLEWADGARDRLAETAAEYGAGPITSKAATEHLAYNCVTRIKKDRARIMGTLHSSTTNAATGQTRPDELHITIKARPGELKVHIYVEGVGRGPTAFDNVKMKGESVVKNGSRDTTLSTGTLPSF